MNGDKALVSNGSLCIGFCGMILRKVDHVMQQRRGDAQSPRHLNTSDPNGPLRHPQQVGEIVRGVAFHVPLDMLQHAT